jgi:hypothetical protein
MTEKKEQERGVEERDKTNHDNQSVTYSEYFIFLIALQ